jgi:hypothetical protein
MAVAFSVWCGLFSFGFSVVMGPSLVFDDRLVWRWRGVMLCLRLYLASCCLLEWSGVTALMTQSNQFRVV